MVEKEFFKVKNQSTVIEDLKYQEAMASQGTWYWLQGSFKVNFPLLVLPCSPSYIVSSSKSGIF